MPPTVSCKDNKEVEDLKFESKPEFVNQNFITLNLMIRSVAWR